MIILRIGRSGPRNRGSFSDVEGQFVKCTNIVIARWIQRVCSLLRCVESMIRLCTHAKRQGRERDSKNAAWPGPTNGKEGRYLVHSGEDKTYYDLRDMYGGHVWRRILLPIVEVGDKVMLEVSSWKDVVHFGKKEMLAPIYKYLADTNLHMHLEEIKIDKTLRFVEEPVGIIDREVKSLKCSRIPIVKSIGTRSEVMRIS
ncbi:hypothetical protein Tco_0086098 [Tanacetum coccineum]